MKKILLTLLTINLFGSNVENAIELLKKKEYKQAEIILMKEAKNLSSMANYLLGYMFYYGEGEFISPKVGIEFIEFANRLSYPKGVIDIECDWKIAMTEPSRCREYINRKVLKQE